MIQLFSAATLQQMSEKEKKEKNEEIINVGEKSAEDVKRIIKKKFSKKENLDTIIFGVVDVKNSNAVIFMKYYIDDTTTISGNFTKKKNSKKNENESFEKAKKEETDE